MRLLPLIAATYFMVSGGPYGLEDIIGKAGYGRALLLLLIIPLIWSFPTSLMVGELASALARRKEVTTAGCAAHWEAFGASRRRGFRLPPASSTWPSTPVIFVLYLGRIEPLWTAGYSRNAMGAGRSGSLCAVEFARSGRRR